LNKSHSSSRSDDPEKDQMNLKEADKVMGEK